MNYLTYPFKQIYSKKSSLLFIYKNILPIIIPKIHNVKQKKKKRLKEIKIKS